MLKYVIISFCFLGNIMCEDSENLQVSLSDYQISSEKYMTDSNGNVMMYVNIWGEVKNPGHHLVYEGIDIGTLLSIVGGSTNNANLKNVRLHRETPDIDGTITYNINLHKFIIEGDRSNFVRIKPNDTIFISSKLFPQILKQVGSINTILGLLNLIYVIQSR